MAIKKPFLQRLLQAYAPMRLRGLMLDGPGRWPNPRQTEPQASTPSTRQRMLPNCTETRHHLPTAWRNS